MTIRTIYYLKNTSKSQNGENKDGGCNGEHIFPTAAGLNGYKYAI